MIKKVLIIPDWRINNPYLNLLTASIPNTEFDFCHFPNEIFSLNKAASKYPDIHVIHLHWINDLIAPTIWASSDAKKLFRRILLAIDLLLVRLRGKRVIWTIHNYVSHETKDAPSELRARSVLARFASHNIVHSPSALKRLRLGYGPKGLEDEHVSIIRHGNYEGCYPINMNSINILNQHFGIRDTEIVLLFFGAIRPYKGIERLLSSLSKCLRKDIKLIIAGNPSSVEYRENLQQIAATDTRVVCEFKFISDAEVSAYYFLSDVVVIPFERTLTSGSAVLAMTMGKALILPQEARELDLVDDSGGLYFSDNSDLTYIIDNLEKVNLSKMGSINREISKGFSWSNVGKLTDATYRS